jgi:glycosyltransferase involved in cell wall biosynthesis
MKKILVFSSFAPSLLLFRAHLIQAFLDEGHFVSVLVPISTIDSDFSINFSKRFPTVKVLSIDMALHGMNPFKDFKFILGLKALFKKEQPDIVLSYTIKPVIYGSIAARWAKVRFIYAMITGLGTMFELTGFKGKLIHQLVKVLYRCGLRQCQKVIFQNPDDQAYFVKLKLVELGKTMRVNGSGVDLSYFSPALLPEKVSFIFIGRLVKEKGIHEFIEAAKQIYFAYPQAKFCVVGDVFEGHPSSIDHGQLQDLKSMPCFDWAGQVADVAGYIAKNSVMVLPSYREGTPRSVLEAMAMGRPIITTDAPGCRETVMDGVNGFLVPIKNVDALVEKMEYFLHNPRECERMGQESRKLVEQKFDVHQVNQVILETILGQVNE